MPIKRLTVAAALVSLLLAAGALQAQVVATAKTQAPASAVVGAATPGHAQAATKSPASAKTHGTSKRVVARTHTKAQARPHARVAHKSRRHHAVARTTAVVQSPVVGSTTRADVESQALSAPAREDLTFHVGPAVSPATSTDVAETVGQVGDATADPAADGAAKVTDLRKALIGLAMNLRDTRYVRGGRDPSTGFDCSGFVRYVFAHAIGMKLPTNSASQFLAGLKVDRADMKPGDLVFFQTGRKHHISHVGIYLSNGRFIHSPATGKTVQVSSLSESYWARHFAGAKRPSGIVAAADNG